MAAAPLNESLIQQWLSAKWDIAAVELELHQLGMSSELAGEYVSAYKKRLISKRQTRGFIYMSVGAFLGFVSCVLTLVNPVPAMYEAVLYGLTSIAVIIIFIGLYLVFEQ